MGKDYGLFSIGHSNHELDHLLHLLRQAGIKEVTDVRSQPFSQRYPHFNRPELMEGLKQWGITYSFLGHLLGGRPAESNLYDADGRLNYERVQQMSAFHKGLDYLCRAGREIRVAMLCSEEDPLDCHRGLLIAPAMLERGIISLHLRGDGIVETGEALESRLLRETGVEVGILDGLFAFTVTAEERRHLVAEAYQKRARQKAFRLRPDPEALSSNPNQDYEKLE